MLDRGKQGSSERRPTRDQNIRPSSALVGTLSNAPTIPSPSRLLSSHTSTRPPPDIDAAIARARRQIELVQEYRTRLIADVVTGKLDVREAAAQLPEEALDEPSDDAAEPCEALEEFLDCASQDL